MQENEYSEKEIVTLSSAEWICIRAGAGTVNSSLEEVYSYLMGCNSTIMWNELDPRPPTPQDALNWIFNELNQLEGHMNFDGLRAKYGSDAATLSAMLDGLKHLRPPEEAGE